MASEPAAAEAQVAAQTAATRVLACPSCGGSVKIRASGISITAVCGSCGSVLDVANPDVRLIAQAQSMTHDPPIPLGSRGMLVGAAWEVVGYQNRTDITEGWSWDEYLLFNPYLGFRFLAQDDENWTLYCMLREDVPDPAAGFDGRRFTLGSTGTVRTNYVLGEFYWRAREGDEAVVAEYVAEPHVLSREQNKEEIIWSRGVRLNDPVIRKAFGLAHDSGAAPATAQTPSRQSRTRGVLWVGGIALFALLMLHAIPFGASHSKVIFDKSFHTTATDQGQLLTSDPFDIPEKGGNLRVSAYSPVQNNWVELNISLVGPDNVTFQAAQSIEYYSGWDSDGQWTEGSQNQGVTLPAVPGGSYRLIIEPYAGAYGDQSKAFSVPLRSSSAVDFRVTLTRHVASTWNFVLALLLLIPYPIYRFFADRVTGYSPRSAVVPGARR